METQTIGGNRASGLDHLNHDHRDARGAARVVASSRDDVCVANGDAVAGFLERFFRFGSAPSIQSYMALFHRDIELFDDGMERPIGYGEIPAHIELTLALVPGFTMVPERWRTRRGTVFVEARNRGDIAGAPASWRAIYRVELEGDLVRRGRRFYDRGPLLRRIDPSTPSLPALLPDVPDEVPGCAAAGFAEAGPSVAAILDRYAAAWDVRRPGAIADLFRDDATLTVPGITRPLARGEIAPYLRDFTELLGGARLTPRTWAGDDSLLFIEWEAAVATPSGAPYALGLVDRLDLVDGRILAARTYFDTASLARALTA